MREMPVSLGRYRFESSLMIGRLLLAGIARPQPDHRSLSVDAPPTRPGGTSDGRAFETTMPSGGEDGSAISPVSKLTQALFRCQLARSVCRFRSNGLRSCTEIERSATGALTKGRRSAADLSPFVCVRITVVDCWLRMIFWLIGYASPVVLRPSLIDDRLAWRDAGHCCRSL